MREKNELVRKRTKAIFIALLVGGAALAFINRIAIRDYINTFIY